MLSCADPVIAPEPLSPRPVSPNISRPTSPPAIRSRRYALLPPPPPPPPPPPDPPTTPPLPARSPLRPTRKKSSSESHTNTTPSTEPSVHSTTTSKRQHALLELLSSERAYASDLALIRDVHIPLALGQPAPLSSISSPPTSPPVTPNTPTFPTTPPMTRDDARIIFGNIEELAVFSEVFCDKLEEAMQGILDPQGDGKDQVADLFISMIPHMTPPYTLYITRHPSALTHLNALPQTPALTAYLSQTHTLAQSYTHAWDLPSLLIKPVQRLLKYPLLLSAIMDDTEPGEAKDKLREARDKVEELARSVNEGRRRVELIKNLLEGKHPPVRVKSIKGLKQRKSTKDEQLDALEKRLRTCEIFVQDFAKNIVDWSISVRDMVTQLEQWSLTFGRVIGLGQSHSSEALDLFTEIVSNQIIPQWIALEAAIQTSLLPKLARLLATTRQPLVLFEHLHALQPQHLQLLDAPISKARPPNSLVEASQSYLALEVQLREEVPQYIKLFECGFMACLGLFAGWQARFFKEVRTQWVGLWDALGIEGNMSAGASEAISVWKERWEEVNEAASMLSITKFRRPSPGHAAALAAAFVAGGGSTSPSNLSPRFPRHHQSMHSIDFIDIDRQLQASPDSYSPYGLSSSYNGSHNNSIHRRESAPSKFVRQKDGDKTSVEGRPGTPRRMSEQAPLTRKSSFRDKLSSSRPENGQNNGSQPSPRVSVHTSSSDSTSGSSSHRLSSQSMDVHIGMDMHVIQRPPSRNSQSMRPYASPNLASVSDLVATSGTLIPLPSPSLDSSLSSKKSSLSIPSTHEDEFGARGRVMKKPSIRQRFSDAFRSSSKKPRASRNSTSSNQIPLPSPDLYANPSSPSFSRHNSISTPATPAKAKYSCTAIHEFSLPGQAKPVYRGKPFLYLSVGDHLEILSEEGHPRDHENLPLRPEDDDCEDCLLLVRDESGIVGWALASFLAIL